MQTFKPRDYQRDGIDHITNTDRGGFFGGMGVGKTVSTLTALDALTLAGEVEKTLITAPLRVAQSTWPDEVAKWEHLQHMRVVPIVGTPYERHKALNTKADIYTINYENIPWLRDTLGNDWPFDTVVADECTKLKSFRLKQGGQRAQRLGQVAHKKTRRWINLTGTPTPNGIKDIWGHQWFVDAGQRLSRTHSAFIERWFVPTRDGYGVEALPHAFAEITRLISDVCLSIEAKDYFDLPPLVSNTIYVDLPPSARKVYREMEKEMLSEIEGTSVEAFNAASKTIKCLQIANGAIYTDPDAGKWGKVHDAKIDALDDIIEEASGAPVLVAYHFKHDLERLQKAFPRGRVLDTKPQTIRDWNAGKIPILFAHPASAGHGLNLQDGGNILAFFGHNWNLEEYQQIIERIGPTRQAQAGHNRPVFVHHIVARNTIDEVVMMRRETKREVQDLLMNELKRRK